jgi:glycosyltransferase involved in cell wall biosynthesis
MSSSPQVAIITRTKDRPLLLRRTIETVLAQTFQDWIHVIVSDGGNQTQFDELVATFSDRYSGRLKTIRNVTAGGRWFSANVGIEESTSKYICILDDDDTWHPHFLERMIKSLSAQKWPDTRGIYCHTVIVNEKIEDNQIIELGRQDFNQWLRAINLFELFSWNRFVPVSFLFERDALHKVGYFDDTLAVCGDWEFNIRFLTAYEIAVLPENLAFWHQRPDSRDSYGNSVIFDQEEHQIVRGKLINRWVRSSFQNGTLGFGEAFGFSLSAELHHTIWHLREKSSEILNSLSEIRKHLSDLSARIQALEEMNAVTTEQNRD